MEDGRIIAPLARLEDDFDDFLSDEGSCSDTEEVVSTGTVNGSHDYDFASEIQDIAVDLTDGREVKTQKKKADEYKVSGKRISREFVQLVDDDDDLPTERKRKQSIQDSNCLICETDLEPSSPVSPGRELPPPVARESDSVRLRRDKYRVETKALARPRSSTPISLATYGDYASMQGEKRAHGHKMKIILPGEEFMDRPKSPRKSPRKTAMDSIWTNFDETSLFSHSRSSIISADCDSPGFFSPKKVLLPKSADAVKRPWVVFDYENVCADEENR